MQTKMCDAACCYAQAEVSHTFLERMKVAKAISLVAWRFDGSRYSTPLPCCDFGGSLESAEAQDELQRKSNRQSNNGSKS